LIWLTLAFLGVPLWLCALAIIVLVLRNKKLRDRHGNVVVRLKKPEEDRWRRAHALWISDVFAWRGSPASWNEDMLHVSGAVLRSPEPEEQEKLHRLGDGFVIATMDLVGGGSVEVAAGADARTAVLGPFAPGTVET
jgi:hypothetical protein